jgi:hypothetical protein
MASIFSITGEDVEWKDDNSQLANSNNKYGRY